MGRSVLGVNFDRVLKIVVLRLDYGEPSDVVAVKAGVTAYSL
jgi:hypothetical protein